MPILTEASALSLWAASRRKFISPIISALAASVSAEDITDGIIDALLSRDDTLMSWLFDRIEQAADRLDERLTWRHVRSDRLREWLEDNDDVYPHLLRGLRALASSIGAEVDRLSAYDTPEAAKADEMRALLSAGGGPAAGFFHLSVRSSETPKPPGSRRGGLTAIEESTALAVIEPSQGTIDARAEAARLYALLTTAEAELAEARADIAALQSGAEVADELPAELEADDTPPADEAEIVSEEEGEDDPLSLDLLPPPPLAGPYDAPEAPARTPAQRARDAINQDNRDRRSPEQTATRATPTARTLRRR